MPPDVPDLSPSQELPVRIRMVQQVAFGESPRHRLVAMRRALLASPFPDPAAPEAPQGVQNVLVLPEMWPVGFFNFDGYRSFAHDLFDDYQQLVVELAASMGCWVFGGSAPYANGEQFHNRSVVASPEGELHYFDKLHLFAYQSREAEILTAGSTLVAFQSPLGNTGILTCFDLRFPESFRALRWQGCEAFVVVAAWPLPRVAHWKALLVARAIENQAWVVGVNGCDVDFGTELGGGSMIVAPDGTVVADLVDEPRSEDVIVSASLTARVREQFPFHDSILPNLMDQPMSFPIVSST
ncbi:nitrilase-related carbon-nitrogen hydrolase [Aeromicrobium sp. CF3.5]|uniref:nitrilase-related carbon-nitrogen hydrolase n=1 Tax=Aeromicrobium sp. CF3.5 TaxID=3373078 RepID=UPI003EE4A468